jgi:hypothetical protein
MGSEYQRGRAFRCMLAESFGETRAKMRHQSQPVKAVPTRQERAEQEVQAFLMAVDSYHTRLAKEPGITFQQHLHQFFAANRKSLPPYN